MSALFVRQMVFLFSREDCIVCVPVEPGAAEEECHDHERFDEGACAHDEMREMRLRWTL